jgi:hypothetical protein
MRVKKNQCDRDSSSGVGGPDSDEELEIWGNLPMRLRERHTNINFDRWWA